MGQSNSGWQVKNQGTLWNKIPFLPNFRQKWQF
jgi:hypothetical protein